VQCGPLRMYASAAGEVRLKVPSCGADLRDGDHRALSAPGELGGGIADRDVPGRRVGATGGGHHRGAVAIARRYP
jgi:hypothetical protein